MLDIVNLMRRQASPHELLSLLMKDELFLVSPLHTQLLFDTFLALKDELESEEIIALFSKQDEEGKTLAMALANNHKEEHLTTYFAIWQHHVTDQQTAHQLLHHLSIENHAGETILHLYCPSEAATLLLQLHAMGISESKLNHLLQKQDHQSHQIIQILAESLKNKPSVLLKLIQAGLLNKQTMTAFYNSLEPLLRHCDSLDGDLKASVDEDLYGVAANSRYLFQFIHQAILHHVKTAIQASTKSDLYDGQWRLTENDQRHQLLKWLGDHRLPSATVASCLTLEAHPPFDQSSPKKLEDCLASIDVPHYVRFIKLCITQDEPVCQKLALISLTSLIKNEKCSLTNLPVTVLLDILKILPTTTENPLFAETISLLKALKLIPAKLKQEQKNIDGLLSLLDRLCQQNQSEWAITQLYNYYLGINELGKHVIQSGAEKDIEIYFNSLKIAVLHKINATLVLNNLFCQKDNKPSVVAICITDKNTAIALPHLFKLFAYVKQFGITNTDLQEHFYASHEGMRKLNVYQEAAKNPQLLYELLRHDLLIDNDYDQASNQKDTLLKYILALPTEERILGLIQASQQTEPPHPFYRLMTKWRGLSKPSAANGTLGTINEILEDGLLRREDNLLNPMIMLLLTGTPDNRRLIQDKLIYLSQRNARIMLKLLSRDLIPHPRIGELEKHLSGLTQLITRLKNDKRTEVILKVITPSETGLSLLYANAPQEKEKLQAIFDGTFSETSHDRQHRHASPVSTATTNQAPSMPIPPASTYHTLYQTMTPPHSKTTSVIVPPPPPYFPPVSYPAITTNGDLESRILSHQQSDTTSPVPGSAMAKQAF